MSNKKLDTNRAYGLAKWVVIILSAYFAFTAVSAYTRLVRVENDKDNCETSTMDYADCLKFSYIIIGNVEKIIKTNVFMAVIPPLTFFGGTALHKYLFRTKEEMLGGQEKTKANNS